MSSFTVPPVDCSKMEMSSSALLTLRAAERWKKNKKVKSKIGGKKILIVSTGIENSTEPTVTTKKKNWKKAKMQRRKEGFFSRIR